MLNMRFGYLQTVADPLIFLPSVYAVVLLRQVTSQHQGYSCIQWLWVHSV